MECGLVRTHLWKTLISVLTSLSSSTQRAHGAAPGGGGGAGGEALGPGLGLGGPIGAPSSVWCFSLVAPCSPLFSRKVSRSRAWLARATAPGSSRRRSAWPPGTVPGGLGWQRLSGPGSGHSLAGAAGAHRAPRPWARWTGWRAWGPAALSFVAGRGAMCQVSQRSDGDGRSLRSDCQTQRQADVAGCDQHFGVRPGESSGHTAGSGDGRQGKPFPPGEACLPPWSPAGT